jgi:hypothetical protein
MNKYLAYLTLIICAFDLVVIIKGYFEIGDELWKYLLVGFIPLSMAQKIIFDFGTPDLMLLVMFYLLNLMVLLQYFLCKKMCTHKK